MATSSNLYNSEWLALVFKNRNQNYGAYVMRKESDRITAKALFIAGSIFVGLFVSPYIFAKQELKDISSLSDKDKVVEFKDIQPIAPAKPKVEEPIKQDVAKPEPAPKVEVQSKKFVSNIKVVEDPVIEEAPKLSELQNAAISNVTQSGTEATGNMPAAIGEGGNGTAPVGDGKGSDETIHNANTIENFPEFPGGMDAFGKFIQKNLRYPYMAQENNIQGKVFLSFVVEKDGSITDVKVTRGVGYGCDEEAMRVIKKSPRWKPGFQNDRPVRVRYQMPINYVMQ